MKLLPQNLMQDCLESYIYKHTTKSTDHIYNGIACSDCLSCALPLIKCGLTVQNAGMVRPVMNEPK